MIELGINMERVRLTKSCLNQTYFKVHLGKMSHKFRTENDLKQGLVLSPLLFNFSLEYVVRKSKKTRKEWN
jgi:hypothetical protein